MSCSNCRCFKMFQVSWWNYETMMKLMFQVVFFWWKLRNLAVFIVFSCHVLRPRVCTVCSVLPWARRASHEQSWELSWYRSWTSWKGLKALMFFFWDLLILWWCFCSQKKITKFSNKWFIVFHRFHWEFSFQNKVFISDPKSINMFFNGFFLLIYHWF